MSNAKNTPKNAGQKGADTSRTMDQKTGQGNGQNRDRSSDKAMKNDKSCGQARPITDIQPHMDVISSCGCTMGKVDHMDGNAIKLTKNDSPDGQHHFIPTTWVSQVDEHVHLNKNAEDTLKEWKTDAASCESCRA